MTATRYDASAVGQRDGGHDRDQRRDDARATGRSPRSRPATPSLVSDRAPGVKLWGVVIGSLTCADERDEVGPGRRPRPASVADRRPGRPARRAPTADRRASGAVSSAQTRMQPGLDLDRRPEGGARPRAGPVVQPAPADGEQQEQDRPDLAELDRVERTATTARPGARSPPAHRPDDRHERRRRPANAAMRSADPGPDAPSSPTAARTAG